MLFLWVFGNNVEDRLGRGVTWRSTCSAAWPTLALQWLVGARQRRAHDRRLRRDRRRCSAGYLVLYPRAVVITLVGWIPLPVPAMLFLLIWIGLQMAAAAGFGQVGSGGGDVAYFAHLGRVPFGLAAIKPLDRGELAEEGSGFSLTPRPARAKRRVLGARFSLTPPGKGEALGAAARGQAEAGLRRRRTPAWSAPRGPMRSTAFGCSRCAGRSRGSSPRRASSTATVCS